VAANRQIVNGVAILVPVWYTRAMTKQQLVIWFEDETDDDFEALTALGSKIAGDSDNINFEVEELR
jgi:hypothetical protein